MSDPVQAQKAAPSVFLRCWHILRGCWRILHHFFGRTFSFLLAAAIVAYFAFCALVLGIRYVVLPNIDAYKPQIEALASEAIGNPVTIGALNASWSGLHPRLALDSVVIHGHDGKPALSLPSVAATLSWWTIAAGELRLNSLEIDRPDLEIARDAQGRLHVAGIQLAAGQQSDGRGADWVLSQREIVIRGGRLRWIDNLRGAPELVLDKVDFVLHNRWRRHRFALHAQPPDGLAAPLDIRARFEHPPFARRISDVSRWKGEMYVDLRDTDLAAWRAWIDYPIDMESGHGSVRAWLDFERAKVADFTADLGLANVVARLQPDLEPLRLKEVSGRIALREEISPGNDDNTPTFGTNGHAVALTDFSLRTEDGLYLPRTTISESYTPAARGRPARTEIQARMVDLETLANFATRLPLPADQRRLLADLAPRGVVRDFSAQWHGVYPAVSAYNVRGQFTGLSLKAQPARPAVAGAAGRPGQAAVPAIPGFANLSGRIEASERGGMLSLASEDVVLDTPGYFAQAAMPFERLAAQANWSFQDRNQLVLDLQRFDFAQEGVSGSLSGKHVLNLDAKGGESPGTIDLSGQIARLEVDRVRRYLPLQTPEHLHEWLSGALLGGHAEDVRIRVKGDLAQFPFATLAARDKPKGEFSVSGRIVNGSLNYAPWGHSPDGKKPEWPIIDQINGRIAFDRNRMDIFADSARSSGTQLSRVKVVIPDLLADEPLLTVDGEAAGPLQNFVRFTHDSPVGQWIDNFTETTRATGSARLALQLQLPLAHMEDAKVRGTLQFAGNTVHLFEPLPPLSGASGALEFNEKGFSLPGVRANFLGGPVSLNGGTQRDGSILVRADGAMSAAGVRQAYAMPMTSRATDRITGGTRYLATVRVRDGNPSVMVESNLVGLGLDFPEPLRKPAQDSLPLRFEMVQSPASDSLLLRDQIRLSLGTMIQAHYEREKPATPQAAWRVVSGGIGVNAPAPEPDSGVYANVNVPSLDLDAWRRAMSSALGPAPQGDGARRSQALSIEQYVEPEVLAAQARELLIMDRKLNNVVVGASHQDGVWQANIDSDQVSGYLSWNEPRSGRGMGRVTARLTSLVIPEAAKSGVADLLEAPGSTEQLPAVDIVAENFELFGKRFGRLTLQARNARGPEGREWRINKLALTNPDGELQATGKWSGRAAASRSTLDYSLSIVDAGRLLDRFGFPKLLRGGKGRMEGNISWDGPPVSLDVESLSGRIKLDVASGQFLKVDPAAQGAAKLLGVLSLQSLPRRLALDFRDVFSEGFAFDGVNAVATISNGVARTENFKMRGVSATVLIDGTADIAKEDQNLHVVVIPEINAGAASVVYGLAVNPAIGVGTFLAQLFLREPLMRAFTFEYEVKGPWKEPVVTRLARRNGADAAQDTNGELAIKLEANG
ncbi:MAG TPA: YhdP family protein [Noviherbaspirillum sp.]|nr:YhdP family protein [Noviherbaspirillum sp.]